MSSVIAWIGQACLFLIGLAIVVGVLIALLGIALRAVLWLISIPGSIRAGYRRGAARKVTRTGSPKSLPKP